MTEVVVNKVVNLIELWRDNVQFER